MSDSIGEILKAMGLLYNVDTLEMTREQWQQKKVDDYNATIGTLDEVDGLNCNVCKNKGHILVLDEAYTEAYRECKCMITRATLRRARNSGLGDIIKDYTFDKYVVTEEWQAKIKEKAKAFCTDEAAKWFYIGGQVGCGKTHLCTAIAAHYIKAGQNVKYMLWAEDAKRLKALVNDASYSRLIEAYKKAPVLYIDDFLKVRQGEEPTTADINLAFEIINHRLMNNSLITIISSEKTLNELLGYDEATMSRIYQKTGVYKVAVAKDTKRNYRTKGGGSEF